MQVNNESAQLSNNTIWPGIKIKMTKAKVKKAAAEYSAAQAQNPDHLEVVNPVAGGGEMTAVTPAR